MSGAEGRQLARLLGRAGIDRVQVPLVVCDADFVIRACSVKRFGNIPVSDSRGCSMISYMAESLPELLASSRREWFRGRLENKGIFTGCLAIRGEINGIRYYCLIEDHSTERFYHAGLSPKILKTLDLLGSNMADAVHTLIENGECERVRLDAKWNEVCNIYTLIDTYCDTCCSSVGKPTMSVESLVRMLTYLSDTVLKQHSCDVEYVSAEKTPHVSIYDDIVVTTLFSAALCMTIMVSGCSHDHIKVEVDDPDNEQSRGKMVFSAEMGNEWEHDTSGELGTLVEDTMEAQMLPIAFELSTALELAKSIGWKSCYSIEKGRMNIEVHFKCARADEKAVRTEKPRSSKKLEITNIDRMCSACVEYRRAVRNRRAAALSMSPSFRGKKTTCEPEVGTLVKNEPLIVSRSGMAAESESVRRVTANPVPVPVPLKARTGN